MIIGGCLLILAVLSLFSIILGTSLIGTTEGLTIDNSIIVDGATNTFAIEGGDSIFFIDPVLGAIVIFIVIIGIASALGVQVVGSGLSPESIRIIMTCILYSAIWGLLSVLASPLIIDIEIFGSLIYMTLTIAYVSGIVIKLGEN